MNRRDLLKYFGVGASIVPVVNGMPQLEAGARLIEVPKIQPLDSTYVIENSWDSPLSGLLKTKLSDIMVSVRQGHNVYHYQGETFVTIIEIVDATSHGDVWRMRLPGTTFWKLEGHLVGNGFTQAWRGREPRK